MTHDALLFFESEDECLRAEEILKSVRVEKKTLFHVETYPNDPRKIFYMLEFTDTVNSETLITWHTGTQKMLNQFTPVVRRTAKHIPEGIVFANCDILPKGPFANHGLYDVVLKFFGKSPTHAS
jgi:hypothetical protein